MEIEYSKVTGVIEEKWKQLTIIYIIYLVVFTFILSYIAKYFLNPTQLRLFYYATFSLPILGFILGWGTDSLPDIFYKKVLI
jgi:hypothetical protein